MNFDYTQTALRRLVRLNYLLGIIMKYFSYYPEEGFELHATAEEAKKAAEDAIDFERGEATDGWSDYVDQICWGEIRQQMFHPIATPLSITDWLTLPNSQIEATARYKTNVENSMAIKIEHDGSGPGEVQENCCKCGNPTRYWFGTGDRNVALCEWCASPAPGAVGMSMTVTSGCCVSGFPERH